MFFSGTSKGKGVSVPKSSNIHSQLMIVPGDADEGLVAVIVGGIEVEPAKNPPFQARTHTPEIAFVEVQVPFKVLTDVKTGCCREFRAKIVADESGEVMGIDSIQERDLVEKAVLL